MKQSERLLLVGFLAVFLALADRAFAEALSVEEKASLDGPALFAQLQGLVGEWSGTLQPMGTPVMATYHLAGKGSALVEEIRRLDKDSSMLTVYHLDGSDLRLTHFCSYRNQPRLRARAVERKGEAFEIEFEFVDVTNLAESGPRYTGRMLVSLRGRDRAAVTFFGVEEGVPIGSITADLHRVSGGDP